MSHYRHCTMLDVDYATKLKLWQTDNNDFAIVHILLHLHTVFLFPLANPCPISRENFW